MKKLFFICLTMIFICTYTFTVYGENENPQPAGFPGILFDAGDTAEFPEFLFDTGDAVINYATIGSPDKPALVLIPGQMESWWGYTKAMKLLSEHFQVFAVDLRGQGKSSRTPGRYTFDNFGNDIIKLITFVIGRPVVVSGLSSGGVISAWLSAYAPPGMLRGAFYEDPPLFHCEINPAYGPPNRQGVVDMLKLLNTYLGDQWSVGDWKGFVKAMGWGSIEPPKTIKEYDPEWARAFATGSVGATIDHAKMLTQVKVPVLFTHHLSLEDPDTGILLGASSLLQANQVERLVKSTGQPFTRIDLPSMGHAMHMINPQFYVDTLLNWAKTLPSEAEVRKSGVFSNWKQK
jgi:pimeloyl-ACP methyl ester carboxylesterase